MNLLVPPQSAAHGPPTSARHRDRFDSSLNPFEDLVAALRALVDRVPGARGASVADRNGLPVANTFPDAMETRIASAMAIMIARAAHGVLDHIGGDRFLFAILEGAMNKILVCDVSEGLGSLILVMGPEADLAVAKAEMIRTAMEITTVIDLDLR